MALAKQRATIIISLLTQALKPLWKPQKGMLSTNGAKNLTSEEISQVDSRWARGRRGRPSSNLRGQALAQWLPG